MNNLRVAILINDPFLNILHPLICALQQHDSFNVKVSACRRIGYEFSPEVPAAEISALLTSHKIEHDVDPTFASLREFRPDFIFTSNPYDMYLDPELNSSFLSSLSRLQNISYGASLINWRDEYEFLEHNPYLLRAYRIYTETTLINLNRSNVKTVGYAKLADYMNGSKKTKSFDLPSITWKPRWTKHDDSAFLTLVDIFNKISHKYMINIVIHPLLLKNNTSSVQNALNNLIRSENVNAITGYDFLDYVLGSDYYIGEISSTLAEFTFTENPILYTGKYTNLNSLGRAIINNSYHASPENIESILSDLADGRDPLRRTRLGMFDKLFPCTNGNPINAILSDMLDTGPL